MVTSEYCRTHDELEVTSSTLLTSLSSSSSSSSSLSLSSLGSGGYTASVTASLSPPSSPSLPSSAVGGGYIASVVTSDTPHCDGATHPWVIRGAPGQRVQLVLYDFAASDDATTASGLKSVAYASYRRRQQEQRQQRQRQPPQQQPQQEQLQQQLTPLLMETVEVPKFTNFTKTLLVVTSKVNYF